MNGTTISLIEKIQGTTVPSPTLSACHRECGVAVSRRDERMVVCCAVLLVVLWVMAWCP